MTTVVARPIGTRGKEASSVCLSVAGFEVGICVVYITINVITMTLAGDWSQNK